ncbi:MAG: co-chaperone GroES [Bifidobacteriaceae bacterium]|jgi:chaperonin GroES|nr:co-chaperone GroES [Bifidobacteriaceae bacterium]
MTAKKTTEAVAATANAEAAGHEGPLEPIAEPAPRAPQKLPEGPLPVRMLSDRLLVMLDPESAERRSAGGILIPVTASVGKRLAWAHVVAIGTHVRQVKLKDRVLFDPADKAEVEIEGQTYTLLRERDIHGVAAPAGSADQAGMYL